MEGGEAVFVVALDTGTMSFFAEIAGQLPSAFRYTVDIVNRFHVDAVADPDFWNPNGTE
jgi:hypothetical protein